MNQSLVPTTPEQVQSIAKSLSLSGFFKDADDQNKAFVKVLAGAELGLPAFISMSGINIVQGKPSLGAGIMAALVKRSEKYNYRIVEHTAEICKLEFFENGQSLGFSEMTMKEAKAANLHMEWNKTKNAFTEKATWKNFPKNMLFNRAMSNGAKWHTPDIFGGPVYAEGELDDIVDTTAEVVHEAKVTPAKTGKKATAQAMKEYQENGTLPAEIVEANEQVARIEKRYAEYAKNLTICSDPKAFNDNEEYIVTDQILPEEQKRDLIMESISIRANKVATVEAAEVVKGRIAGWKNVLGPDKVTEALTGLVDAAGKWGVKYENRKFYQAVDDQGEIGTEEQEMEETETEELENATENE